MLTDHLILHFIELPKVGKNMVKSSLEMWSQYFINEGGENNIMKTLLKDEPIIEKAHNEFKKFTADEHLREIYESRLKAQRDHAYFMEVAREEGLKEGIEQAVIETAQKMLADGLAVDVISKYTGLTVEKINTLQSK
ncbi:MAG TPA: Rpn family recombination-promoting nuclease/putative transposase [Spirochaetota bacterium]|nr:Rpn family recombination-promoting nuclease/putative transposase [Spirochaetota bacterium]